MAIAPTVASRWAFAIYTAATVLLFGAGIKSGHYAEPASPADIVPTLAAMTGVQMPKTDGRVLREALIAPPSPTTP